jgi:hypothetical protein
MARLIDPGLSGVRRGRQRSVFLGKFICLADPLLHGISGKVIFDTLHWRWVLHPGHVANVASRCKAHDSMVVSPMLDDRRSEAGRCLRRHGEFDVDDSKIMHDSCSFVRPRVKLHTVHANGTAGRDQNHRHDSGAKRRLEIGLNK